MFMTYPHSGVQCLLRPGPLQRCPTLPYGALHGGGCAGVEGSPASGMMWKGGGGGEGGAGMERSHRPRPSLPPSVSGKERQQGAVAEGPTCHLPPASVQAVP